MDRFSNVILRDTKETKQIKLGSELKPDITGSIIKKWQSLLDTLAGIINVPSSLIMRLNEETIEVFLKSNTEENPYEVGEEAQLIYGLYCETVIGTQEKLIVPDATKSMVWKENNPDVDIDMISYMGVPINWPDGECFGTVCVLDNKENHYGLIFEKLIVQVKQHIETDLKLAMSMSELEEMNQTKSKFLSLISHDIRGSLSSADNLMKLIIQDIETYDRDELKELLLFMSQSFSKTHHTLENLLSWSKNDLVQIKPAFERFNSIKVLDEILMFFATAIKIKRLEIRKDYYSDEAIIKADRNMISTSLRNIISNAIKFSPSGGVITIKLSKIKNKHSIKISDTGLGMHKLAVDNLFSYSNKNIKSGTQGESSSGLGLILTKEFLDMNGATVSVESELNKGTMFSITI